MNKPMRGFTLIELMVVVILMGIILGMGIPSFQNLIEKMAIEAEAEMFVEGMRTARLTAIEERKDIVVCTSSNSTSCGGTWEDGFIVYRDDNGDNSLNGTEEVLYSHQFRQSVIIKTGSGDNQNFFYNNNGWTPGSADRLLFCAEEGSQRNAYMIVISQSGRLRILDSQQDWEGKSC